MSNELSQPEAKHGTEPTSYLRVTGNPGSDRLCGASSGRSGLNETSTPRTRGAVRHIATAPATPEITITGELSDDAIEALAALLVDSFFASQNDDAPAATEAT